MLLSAFFYFVQPRQSRAFLNGIQCFKNGQYTFFTRKTYVNLLPCVEAFDAVYFCVLCFSSLTKLKKPNFKIVKRSVTKTKAFYLQRVGSNDGFPHKKCEIPLLGSRAVVL